MAVKPGCGVMPLTEGLSVLVVGSTGTVGSALVADLVGRGVAVRALTRGREARHPHGADFVVGDLSQPGTLPAAFEGVGRVFIITNDPALEPAAIDAAVDAGVDLVVLSSAMGPGGSPPSAHAAAETYLAGSGAHWVVLRPNAFMQTLAQYLPPLVDADGCFVLPAGSGRTGWVDARDIAASAAALLTDDNPETGVVHTITGPASLSMDAVAQDLTDARDHVFRYRPIDPSGAVAELEARGLPAPMAGFLAGHYAAVRSGDFDVVTDDVPRLCGRPARTWRAFLDDHPELF